MNLKSLIYRLNVLKVIGPVDITINDIHFDSRNVNKNGLFIAVKGSSSDGHEYVEDSISKGAVAVIVEDIPSEINTDITYIQVLRSCDALGVIAANFYDNPSKHIRLVGVTGTNGKTTTVSLLYQLFTLLGNKVGMISTIGNKVAERLIPSTHTTPDAIQINYLLSEMIRNGCTYCFMEVSSHAIDQGRVSGLSFSGGVFTNITQDHLDYHKTFASYRDVKKSFFDSLSKHAFALINKDDRNANKMLEITKARKTTYALKTLADYRCKILENQLEGMILEINKINISVRLAGEFNGYNILAVYAVAKQFISDDTEILRCLSMLETVEGRFQFIANNDSIIGIVDYAHTEDALKNVIETINQIRIKSEQLITVVGCGGDRDKSKRSLMAQVACDLSSQVILTSDNPRSEDPDKIIEDMLRGLDHSQKKKILVIPDRRQAIIAAGKLAKQNDVILVAGKGHEKYQEIKGKKTPFDDMKELKESLNII